MPEAAAAAPAAARRPRPRRGGWWGLIVAVALAHLLLVNQLSADRLGGGAADRPPARIEVAFVRDLKTAAPPVVAVAAPHAAPVLPPRLPAVAAAPLVVAAADAAPPPAPAASTPPPLPAPPLPAPPEPMPPLPSADVPPAAPTVASSATAGAASAVEGTPVATAAPPPAAAAQPAATASAASFDWPPSTRLSYKLNGYFRGPVTGSAQVEWLRQGERYQVRMSTSIGPVLSRNIVSDGVLGAQGLVPQRFSGEQKVLFRAAKRWSFSFEPERVLLDDGSSVPSVAGVQDEASQFVQLTWLFTTRPDRLRVGQAIDVPLLVSRRLNLWTYDVVGEETLHFPFGAVPTFHVKPRREASGGDLSAEMWIAPSLQYLPVRILIRQNVDSQADLTLERLPEQAAR